MASTLKIEKMKTLNIINGIISVTIAIVLMSTNLDAQKAYHKVTLENGITELNNMANRLIEKCKIKFDLNNSVSVSEMHSLSAFIAENELTGLTEKLLENAKFDVSQTITVTEANEENSELNRLTDNLMANMKFDVNKSISITEAEDENIELNQLSDVLLANMKFDVNQTISVTEAIEENSELNRLMDELMAVNVKFDLNKTISVQEDQIANAF